MQNNTGLTFQTYSRFFLKCKMGQQISSHFAFEKEPARFET